MKGGGGGERQVEVEESIRRKGEEERGEREKKDHREKEEKDEVNKERGTK